MSDLFVGNGDIRKLMLTIGMRAELIYFAKQLLLDGEAFKRPSLLVLKSGEISPQFLSGVRNDLSEGWSYFIKIQEDNPDLSPSALIEKFCTVGPEDSGEMACEKNLFCVRVVEALRQSIKENAPEIANDKARATQFLRALKVPSIPKNPQRIYPDALFAVSVVTVGAARFQYVDTRRHKASLR